MAGENRPVRPKQHSKSGKTMNRIELLIFGAMTVYIIVVIVMYFNSDPIMGYSVQMGSLSVSKTYTGIALREEEIIRTPYTGYINYYVREGERVSSRDTVYSIDESGKLATLLNSGELGENKYSDDELAELRADIIQYDSGFDSKDFATVYDFKYNLEGAVMKLVNINIYESMDTLNQSSLGGMVSLCPVGKSGYVVYNTDNYEGLTPESVNAELFDRSAYERSRVNNNDLVQKNDVVGKLVTNENWSLIIPIEKERSAELEEESYVKVKFIKTQETSWGEVFIHHLADGDYAQLTFTNSCKTFCSDRFVDIELVVNDKKGLKIPQSAIAQKEFFIVPAEYMSKGGEKGNYGVTKESYTEEGELTYRFIETTVYNANEDEFYVDNSNLSVGEYICKPNSTDKIAISKSGTLTGVYNMNKGYADFKQITILDENDEYAVVSSNTQYGLTVYDRIVLDAASVNTDDFIYHK